MPNYSYKALDPTGITETGVLIADNLSEAQEELKNRRLIPINLKSQKIDSISLCLEKYLHQIMASLPVNFQL